ncbi:MAG TPA: Glu/Leu/Phe/Val dehydrogenase dimerization domain-containing protein, partial [Conexibacter sp.]|nr:Glu/Leu/Phe/Val dehydrogenase dimerization domain-containing protein [Conexibacter sp.]
MTDLGDALLRSLAWEHERVQLVQDADCGLQAAIAIHSTVLGPALGGLRIRRYEGGLPEALDDALRLSRAMTLKASAAGLDLGGGKAVMVDDGTGTEDTARRGARLRALAREVERLDGAYVTAEDLGTTTADMDLIAEHTNHVVGTTRRGGLGGDPSPSTARTVLGAMAAALDVLDGDDALTGRVVGVIGLGKVGARLAERLLEAGARVVGTDPVAEPCRSAAALGVEIVAGADELLARRLDVLAPCAVGGMVD